MDIFIDTSAFIALIDKGDRYHKVAKNFILKFKKEIILYTSNYIIDETITRLRKTAGFKIAMQFGEIIFSTSNFYQIYYIDPDLEQFAFEIFKKFSDKDLSFTDCTSFALMKRLRLKKAFAFDEDFIHAGFELYPLFSDKL
jgi:hypothetical protein